MTTSRPPGAGSATRSLLRCGIIAGPFYLAVGLAQALIRDGFDLARHPLSVLANGSGGWIQTANFVLTGAMVIAAAIGLRRALAPASRLMSGCLGVYGLCMIAAAIFPADPVDGFPIGTPEGFPTTISTPGLLHFMFGTLGFIALAVSCYLAARALSRHGIVSLARWSRLAGHTVVLGFFGGMVLPIGVAGIWLAVVVGWVWLTALSRHLSRNTVAIPTGTTAEEG